MHLHVLLDGQVIGDAYLPRPSGMGNTSGPFFPAPAYEHIRPFFRHLFEVLHTPGIENTAEGKAEVRRCYTERDLLQLSIVDLAGRQIPTNAIIIWDLSAELDGEAAYQADVNVNWEAFREDFTTIDWEQFTSQIAWENE